MNASSGPLPHSESAVVAGSMPTVDPDARRAAEVDVEVVEIHAQPPTQVAAPPGPDRRRSGGRSRATDRLLDRATRDYPKNLALDRIRDVETTMLFVDDDLRETALAIGRIETYLVHTLQTLERRDVVRADVVALARDTSVLDHLDALNETVESLRCRLGRLAARMR
ncbi:MAG: hypothetical protein AAF721_04145 [Myxococcota bacterium]